ncbi:MAG: peptidoglycan-binding protein [Microcystis sp. M54BS1]|uniref:peptidoglycan-binding domain-containing protein n=1 Tax=unclassified Microcystis TaxID=2643300 RepID=UPI0025795429|nr:MULTISPECIES: peptidoglycan-binding domain-containing protein [unclassified Microcystis]MCA2542288.1 peptidoglycan-binding protein [Microcystis sp. M54BS1]MCA2597181.1 peptidoglycan-binding protein [Microcystis sp. M38BS1]MCA2610010.1 peptidoglycan-binding protein [Microcystis sp. M27BS1]MCA2508121.1 peptidoglycan-binding protein [Microcystis sp. M62BS1]MCA2512514.1 peptidoglycan-binding protein [Microcystis sp. M60BS1]
MLFVSTYPGTLLKLGVIGENVKKVQRELNNQGYPCPDNGNFDENTKQRVIQFQAEHNLAADGIVGPLTWEKLFQEIPPKEPSANTMTVLRTMKERVDIYHKPTFQDNEGRGIWALRYSLC